MNWCRPRLNFKAANGDVALHFSPHMDDHRIALNSSHGNIWAPEEYLPIASLRMGESFELSVRVKKDRFVFDLNGARHGEFRHRMARTLIEQYETDGFEIVELQHLEKPLGSYVRKSFHLPSTPKLRHSKSPPQTSPSAVRAHVI